MVLEANYHSRVCGNVFCKYCNKIAIINSNSERKHDFIMHETKQNLVTQRLLRCAALPWQEKSKEERAKRSPVCNLFIPGFSVFVPILVTPNISWWKCQARQRENYGGMKLISAVALKWHFGERQNLEKGNRKQKKQTYSAWLALFLARRSAEFSEAQNDEWKISWGMLCLIDCSHILFI